MRFKIKIILVFILFVFLVIQCIDRNKIQDNKLTSLDSLYHLVGEKHDTAMLLMKDIKRFKINLRKRIQENDSLGRDTIYTILGQLNRADDAMMNWMRNFKSRELDNEFYDNTSKDSIRKYLKSEERAIESVHSEMIESINVAKGYFK